MAQNLETVVQKALEAEASQRAHGQTVITKYFTRVHSHPTEEPAPSQPTTMTTDKSAPPHPTTTTISGLRPPNTPIALTHRTPGTTATRPSAAQPQLDS